MTFTRLRKALYISLAMNAGGYPPKPWQRRITLRRVKPDEEIQDTMGVSPWSFTKLLSIFAIVLPIISSTALSIDEIEYEGDAERTKHIYELSHLNEDLKVEEEEENIFHTQGYLNWSLSHWFFGFVEYPQRCLWCGTNYDPRRVYLLKDTDGNIIGSTDCMCIENRDCDNPIMGTLCCPLVTLGHLFCLPFALCGCPGSSKSSPDIMS